MGYVNDLADACRGSGLPVWEDPNWQENNHGPFATGPTAIVCHHTGSSGSGAWTVVRDGRPGLDGPLAQLTLERDGTVRVLANGESWHAGRGSWPSIGRNNANSRAIGIEAVYNGSDITDAQREAYPRLCAALCRHYPIPVGNVIGHREWAPDRKVDPGRIDMPDFRREVAALLAGRPAPAPVPPRPKGLPNMIHVEVHKPVSGRLICPVGSASAVVAKAWFSASFDGGARVQAWFQDARPGSDAPAPGTRPAVDWTLGNAERAWVELPSGTEFVQYSVTNLEGPGAIAVEMAAK